MSSTKWLDCRLSDIQDELGREHRVSKPVISRLLKARDYRLRSNRKRIDHHGQHPERDRQFKYIQTQRKEHAARQQPQLSVDTKKEELIGEFKNAGQVWCQEAVPVNSHDFKQDARGRAVPYGIYDQQCNLGTVGLGRSADTPAFAVDNIALWCATERLERFPHATAILIEADCGGSNSVRARAWKWHLQEKVADRFEIAVTVCHDPTGTSKWNPVEHRLSVRSARLGQVALYIALKSLLNISGIPKPKLVWRSASIITRTRILLAKKSLMSSWLL